MTSVNIHNEWDPLTEVIVGRGIPDNFPAADFTFKLFFHDNIYGTDFLSDNTKSKKYQITKQHIEEHNSDLDNFASLLESLNVVVRRPKVPRSIEKVRTRHWSSECHPSLNCRDLCLVIGNKIIETPVSCRWRYYETDYLKHIFHEYFLSGAQWICAPRPLMLDNSFDITDDQLHNVDHEPQDSYMDYGLEIMFDAANCIKLGRHILINVSNENQRLGLKWLKSVIGDEYVIWDVNLTDSHIDSSIIPVKPGVAIITREWIKDKLPLELQKWDLIYIPQTHLDPRKERFLASPKIHLNFLSVSPECIICHTIYADTLRQKLKPYNIEVIPTPIRHSRLFSGGHHCTTLDINRTGCLEDYFN